MPQHEPITILMVSEQAETIKLVTIGLRGFFPGCRVEVAYSAEEARSWPAAHEWTLILIDEHSLAGTQASLPGELKQRAPYASIILHSDRTESAAALHARYSDIDFFLSKQSPAFLTELLFCTKEAIEKHRLRVDLDHARERQRRLTESLGDVVYELDAAGRFVTISPGVSTLLGYSPDELIGRPYTNLVSPDHEPAAQYRFNERRSGTRGTNRAEIIFRGKSPLGHAPRQLAAEVSARGLYDPLRRFLGTVGFIRDLSQLKQQDLTIQQLHQQLHQADERIALAQRVTTLSQQLHTPLASLLTDSQQLLSTILNAPPHDPIGTTQGPIAGSTTHNAPPAVLPCDTPAGPSVSNILDDILAHAPFTIAGQLNTLRQPSTYLPPLAGDREQVTQLLRHLLHYAHTYLLMVGRRHQLTVRTGTVTPPAPSPDTPAPPSPAEVEVELIESDLVRSSGDETVSLPPIDLLEAYRLIRQLGGTIDFTAPMQGPLRIAVRLPCATQPPLSHLPLAMAASSATLTPDTSATVVPPIQQSDSGPSGQERRQAPRMHTALPAKITIGSAAWDGTISNLSLGGTCVSLPIDFPASPPQNAHVTVKTAVGILELQGTAQTRPISPQTKTPTAQLVVAFGDSNREERAILASLLHATQEQALPLSIEMQLATPAEPMQLVTSPRATAENSRQAPREAVRVALQFPVRLEITDAAGRSHSLGALTTNLSRSGACLHLIARPDLLTGSITLHFSSLHAQPYPGTHEPGAPDAALPATMIWYAPDPTASQEFRNQKSDPSLRIGLRFHTLTPHAEREVNRVVRQHLASPNEQASSSQHASVVSLPRECRNPRGQTIAITEDHLRQSPPPNAPIVVIAPGYGQTALDNLALSYYLTHHRLRILRYDHTNHVGLSDGELQQTTLRSMQADLLKIVEFAQQTWPTAPLIVLASDITARVALKVAKQSRPLDLLLLINPVVDMQATLLSIHRHDLVADYRYGLRRGIANLLGLNIDMDRFVGDMVAGHLTDLASTISDLRLLHVPSAILTTPPDPLSPLPPADLPQAFLTALGSHAKLATVSTPLRAQDLPLNEPHPPIFQPILDQIIAAVSLPADPAELNEHAQQELGRQQHIEMERTRLRHNLSHLTRETLWAAHLQQVPQLGNLHAYWKLLDDFYRLVSPLEPDSLLMDVEVGHGDLVRATMLNQAYRSRQRSGQPARPVHMIGIGHSRDSLTQARQNLRTLHRELDNDFAGTLTTHPPLSTNWVLTHWAESLPFKDNTLHHIVCNLSLSFVPSPLVTVRELYRILHPQGRLVLTFFHRDTDLSGLYRRHLQQANQDEFTPQAQLLLQYFGRLREAIRHGLLHTFDQSSLTAFLLQAGIATPRILPALDNQAFFAIIEKDKSAS